MSRKMVAVATLMVLAGVGAAGHERVPLIDAVKNGDRAAVSALLKKGSNASAQDVDGTTALHWAAHRNDLDTANLLIAAGAKVNAANRYGMTPLLLAVENADGSPVVEALLKAGADANTGLPEGETPIMAAARAGNVQAIKTLAAFGAKVDSRESWHGQTALMWAAAEDHGEAIKTLIELGSDLNTRTDGGFTPLLFAVRDGRPEAVKALLDAGANVNDAVITTRPGRRPSAASAATAVGVQGGRNNAANAGGGLTPVDPDSTNAVVLAINNRHYEMAKLLLERGADPNGGQNGGWTALHELAYVRRPNTGKGMPPAEDKDNVDTLELAKMLIEHGADINARQKKERTDGLRNEMNRIGATPLLLAAKHADVPFMRFLAAHGADPHLTTENGITVIAAAAGVGIFNVGESAGTNEEAFEAVKLAYELGSTDVNAANWETGWQPIHGAAKRGSEKIVRFLAEKGSDLDAYTYKEGWLAVRIADGIFIGGTVKRSDDTAELLRTLMKERGIEPPAKNTNDVADPNAP